MQLCENLSSRHAQCLKRAYSWWIWKSRYFQNKYQQHCHSCLVHFLWFNFASNNIRHLVFVVIGVCLYLNGHEPFILFYLYSRTENSVVEIVGKKSWLMFLGLTTFSDKLSARNFSFLSEFLFFSHVYVRTRRNSRTIKIFESCFFFVRSHDDESFW